MSKIVPIAILFELFGIVFGVLSKSVPVIILGVLLLGLTVLILKNDRSQKN